MSEHRAHHDSGSGDERHFVGVGVGPGDPELVTLKAVRILETADVILVPSTEASADGPGRAEQIITQVVPDGAARIRRIPFSMAQRRGVGARRAESWRASADAAVEAFESGSRTVAFATVGDPAVFSTFSYLRATLAERMPGVGFELVPGITAMQALAAASTTPLAEGREILALVPATVGPDRIAEVLDVADSVAIYKGGRTLPEVLQALRERGRQAVIGTDVSLPGQQLAALDEIGADETLPYFSAVLTTPERTITGGRI
ncbi:precorrin-2 C(20)-methyltransferase [Propionibacterium australiense]|uniref:Cobalt-precorrin-2 C(20)-methyltransferase n=1 Tax=Propionibacterium australiense TaxID=119981 RepID=A0A8B3FSK7_9ACTN|nr:precorrin-2 C(20)-methyltransferase [Propionibacterium australiense]RLP10817.1 precorrin-2 C(20)-methyltransferase [Propionibacterium australiense]